jgi:hypothetical protein
MIHCMLSIVMGNHAPLLRPEADVFRGPLIRLIAHWKAEIKAVPLGSSKISGTQLRLAGTHTYVCSPWLAAGTFGKMACLSTGSIHFCGSVRSNVQQYYCSFGCYSQGTAVTWLVSKSCMVMRMRMCLWSTNHTIIGNGTRFLDSLSFS